MEKKPIVFLTVPDSLKSRVKGFDLDASILLPVEVEAGSGEGGDENAGLARVDSASLSLEMILSGMLRVIAGDFDGGAHTPRITERWLDYYRALVCAVKPEIYHEFTCAAMVKADNEDFDTALEINAILEGLFPRSPGVLLNKALILEKKAAFVEKDGAEGGGGDAWNAPEAAYLDALATQPLLPDTLFNAGFFFVRRKRFARARDCFFSYTSLEEEETEEAPEKKKQAQRMLAEINSQHLDEEAYREAYDCIIRGEDEAGLLKIRQFIEKHPKVWNGWFVLGWALRKLARYDAALAAFQKTTELGGGNTDTRNEIAICLMESGDLKGARKELERALQEEPENIKIISNLGVLAMKGGNKDEAAAFFRTALELDPADSLAAHFLAKL
ncbi:MAG: tetratricopeptide repeat protein [Treponema sp.]|nr:tetratricopeptide repeat protein [Treponema sp.]